MTVFDKDLAAHDEAGTHTEPVTGEMLRAGGVTWSFGQVESIRLDFRP
ncbi:MAG TPA: hypothetical protein VIL46_02295 [Gemmataceae bacterium]